MIQRMVDLGIPESTAIEIFADFVMRGRENFLLQYIEAVEHERMAAV